MNNFLQNPHLQGESFYLPAGPVGVLLIHGFTATTAEVRLLGEKLNQYGYTISAPLLPGHGTTPQNANRYRWRDWTGCVEQAYHDLASQSEQVFVAGESLGGLLALYLASQTDQLSGVMVYAPALSLVDRRAYFLAPLLAPVVRIYPKSSNPPNLVSTRWQGYTVIPLRAAVQVLRLQKVVNQRLPLISQPLLVMQGRLDRAVHERAPLTVYSKVSSDIKELHWMESSEHCVMLDCELDDVTTITLRFMADVLEKAKDRSLIFDER